MVTQYWHSEQTKPARASSIVQIARHRLKNPKLSKETRYKDLFDQTPVGILEQNYSIPKQIIDSLGIGNSIHLRQYFSENPESLLDLVRSIQITDINISGMRAYGARTAREFIDDHMDFDEWLNHDWVSFYLEELVALFDQALPFSREFTDVSLDDRVIEVRNVTHIVSGCEHDWSRIISTVEDVTERKKMEAQLHQAQKMDAIGQLTGGLAHDVNNILAIISGNSEIIERELGDENLQSKEIFHAIDMGSALVRQLMSFSRKQPLDPQALNVNKLVTNLTQLLDRTLGETIEIRVNTAENLWAVETDQSRLENSILNLVLNARDAMPDGGNLAIKTQNKTIKKSFRNNNFKISAGDYVVLSVNDDGAGMSNEEMLQVFEPFYTTKEIGLASGLGLSSVYGFVNQTGGHVTINSIEGVGSSVSLYLPRSKNSEGFIIEKPPEEMLEGLGEAVLVVEDEPILRNLVIGMLKDLGYETLVASNGPEALEILKSGEVVHILLTDIGLPGGISGVSLAEKAADYHPDIKFQFMSGYIEDFYSRYPDIDNYGPVLDKPFRKVQLAQTLRAVLNQSG